MIEDGHSNSDIKIISYKGIPVEQLPYEMAIDALEVCPISSKYYWRMAHMLIEQHKNLTFGVVEEIIAKRKKV